MLKEASSDQKKFTEILIDCEDCHIELEGYFGFLKGNRSAFLMGLNYSIGECHAALECLREFLIFIKALPPDSSNDYEQIAADISSLGKWNCFDREFIENLLFLEEALKNMEQTKNGAICGLSEDQVQEAHKKMAYNAHKVKAFLELIKNYCYEVLAIKIFDFDS